jgi:hypothetical protein
MTTPSSLPPGTLVPGPNIQCSNENQGEGCGLTFPAKTVPGLCERCRFLDSLDPNTEQYAQASVIFVSVA